MICPICEKEYEQKNRRLFPDVCVPCSHRIKAWGYRGAAELVKIARNNKDLTADFIYDFCDRYYIGAATTPSDKASVMKRALVILNWSGKIIGGRHRRNKDYFHRRVAHMSYYRKHAKTEACEMCGTSENLHLHHVVPAAWGGMDFFPDEVLTVCESCHRVIHERLSRILTNDLKIKFLEPYKYEILKLAQSTILNPAPQE